MLARKFVGKFGPAPTCPDIKRRPGALTRCFCLGRRYTCPGCLRFVPWCFGAADDAPELCDDCWGAKHAEAQQGAPAG